MTVTVLVRICKNYSNWNWGHYDYYEKSLDELKNDYVIYGNYCIRKDALSEQQLSHSEYPSAYELYNSCAVCFEEKEHPGYLYCKQEFETKYVPMKFD